MDLTRVAQRPQFLGSRVWNKWPRRFGRYLFTQICFTPFLHFCTPTILFLYTNFSIRLFFLYTNYFLDQIFCFFYTNFFLIFNFRIPFFEKKIGLKKTKIGVKKIDPNILLPGQLHEWRIRWHCLFNSTEQSLWVFCTTPVW